MGNRSSRADPAQGSRKRPPPPANPRDGTDRKPCPRRESPQIPAQLGSATTGLSRRRSRVRVPSLPSRKSCNSPCFVVCLGADDRRFPRRPPALTPHGRSPASRTQKVLHTRMFCRRHSALNGHGSSVIPRRSGSRMTVLGLWPMHDNFMRRRHEASARCPPDRAGSPLSLSEADRANDVADLLLDAVSWLRHRFEDQALAADIDDPDSDRVAHVRARPECTPLE
jgi:hypothetical protein